MRMRFSLHNLRAVGAAIAIAGAVSTVGTVATMGAQAAGSIQTPIDVSQAGAPDALLAMDRNRIEVIEQILARFADELKLSAVKATALPVPSRDELKGWLEQLRADRLLAASLVGSLDGVLSIAQGQQVASSATLDRSKATGEPTRDLVYTPINPGRMIDTRGNLIPTCFPGVGNFANGEIRNYTVAGCLGIPAGVSAVQAVVYTKPVSSVSDIFADAQGGTFGAVAVEGANPAAFSGGTATIPVNPSNNQIGIKNVVDAATVIVDVVGYFMPPNRTGDGLRVFGAGTGTPSVVNGDDSNTVGSATAATNPGPSR